MAIRSNFSKLSLIVSMGIIAGCGAFPPNAPLQQFDAKAGYRFENLHAEPGNSSDMFVVLVFSGGGTRAAALAYGVLEALEKTTIEWQGQEKTLLDEVDVISSISGGSFTAAYYGLNRKRIFAGEYEQNFLKADVEGDLFKLLLNPRNLLQVGGRSFGRSDLAAAYYDTHVFNGASFDTLLQQGTLPFVVLNATDMTLGSQFPFVQDQFDLICSDLAKLKIARAVTSSSAFPGLLSPLTYQNYASSCGFVDESWVANAAGDRAINMRRTILADNRLSYYDPASNGNGRRDFIHLVDGGVADNIGVRGVINSISTTDASWSILERINNREIKKLVVIVVNAATDPDTTRDKSASVPNVFDLVETAATIPLDNYSTDSVALLQHKIDEMNNGYQSLQQCMSLQAAACPAANSAANLDLAQLAPVDSFVIEVAFDFVANAQERHFLKNIGTNFSLPAATVDELIDVGCRLLAADDQFVQLLAGTTGYTGIPVSGQSPQCN